MFSHTYEFYLIAFSTFKQRFTVGFGEMSFSVRYGIAVRICNGIPQMLVKMIDQFVTYYMLQLFSNFMHFIPFKSYFFYQPYFPKAMFTDNIYSDQFSFFGQLYSL